MERNAASDRKLSKVVEEARLILAINQCASTQECSSVEKTRKAIELVIAEFKHQNHNKGFGAEGSI